MGSYIDTILTMAALIIGVMMLLGKGDYFLNDKNATARNKKYNVQKAQRAFGIALLVVGIATPVSAKVESFAGVPYTTVVVIAFGLSFVYMKLFCKK